ncbi:hypothetical protein SAMN02745166_03846 [Prosthecobacter debontii]|uniref:Uncharacterized protein n=1 Tax=Prosthecobacter debontii TaxID=48467 RepID=A0A1T4YPG1_9BACT|nr:hypothetical protein [Prosthecobacter debontii]SKB03573.1 hypothetical protein SAMN02745166_03846 [Prosthecobacter debontii]
MIFSVRFSCIFSLICASIYAQDSLLPLPEGGADFSGLNAAPAQPEIRFLKPSKSIKPPTAGPGLAAATAQPQINAPTVARLRKLILMPGGMSPEMMREQIIASGRNRTPVTIVGMDAPAPILTNLANFFGSDVNADTQKQLLDTVSQGLGDKTAKTRRRVEVVGWLPSEGVMAVAVYPES